MASPVSSPARSRYVSATDTDVVVYQIVIVSPSKVLPAGTPMGGAVSTGSVSSDSTSRFSAPTVSDPSDGFLFSVLPQPAIAGASRSHARSIAKIRFFMIFSPFCQIGGRRRAIRPLCTWHEPLRGQSVREIACDKRFLQAGGRFGAKRSGSSVSLGSVYHIPSGASRDLRLS